MIRLTREFRFSLAASGTDLNRVGNSWAGWFSSNQIAAWLTLRLSVCGQVQPQTGYLCNVKLLDEVMRGFVEKVIRQPNRPETYEQLIVAATQHAKLHLPQGVSFSGVQLTISPTLHYNTQEEPVDMVSLTQQFEFSAAHRLHCEEFSDEENRNIFGKCNNPEGHGHNYVVELTLGRELENPSGQVISLAEFEKKVKHLVIDRLDHKHLNRDVAEFQKLNPSVENIAIKIWDWLSGEFSPARLTRVRVYETPKTWADFFGPDAN